MVDNLSQVGGSDGHDHRCRRTNRNPRNPEKGAARLRTGRVRSGRRGIEGQSGEKKMRFPKFRPVFRRGFHPGEDAFFLLLRGFAPKISE